MSDVPRHDVELSGCTPEPLMAYLKALGILRLVSEQKDADARGWWEGEVFRLRSTLNRDALVKFFLEGYKPTPIVAPWAGGSGFFGKDNKQAVEALCDSKSLRCSTYAGVIRRVREIIEDEQIGEKPKDDEKVDLIRRYRCELPDDVVGWMDAAMVLRSDGQSFSPLLGTGGNDGRLDFTQNFMQRIVSLGLHQNVQASEPTRACLLAAFFASLTQLGTASVGQFAPGRAGGPNATQGMEGSSTDNPWDFILMLEGSLILAGAAARRYGTAGSARASFPFTVRSIASGFTSPASKDEADSRGELWLPLWSRPTSVHELRQLFGEGRAEVSGRPARDGVDFARAAAGLGVDRGIGSFSRIGLLKRSGKAFLATPIGRFQVAERRHVDLLQEIDPWLDRFRHAAGDKNAPPRFGSALRRIDSAIFELCKYGGEYPFQNILIALGAAERELALTPGRIGQSKWPPGPLAGLSGKWVEAAHDNSPEFAMARALAALYDADRKIGSLRANMEPVNVWYDNTEGKQKANWAEKDRAVVWNAADLSTNLANVLGRRVMDGDCQGCERLPLASPHTVSLNTVALFIAGELNEKRIEQLIWGLMLVDHRQSPTSREREGGGEYRKNQLDSKGDGASLARDYALLKLLFLPRPLAAGRQGEERDESGIVIRPEPSVLPLLRAGRVGEACRIAARRLLVSGLPPMPGPLATGVIRDTTWTSEWEDRPVDHRAAQRLTAALLIPISSNAINHLVHLVCRDQAAAAESLALADQGVTE